MASLRVNPPPRPRWLLPGLIVLLALLACAALVSTFGAVAPPSAVQPAPTSAPDDSRNLPPNTAWPAPDPDRPVVDLTYDMAADLRSAIGHTAVEFRPDLPVCELVFRAWPNKPSTASDGNALTVTSATLGSSAVGFTVHPGGTLPGRPGTLIEIPLDPCAQAGEVLTATLHFKLTLGTGTDERVGVSRTERLAWFGTAFPLLAWQRGRGWAREDAVAIIGETTTSETFRLRSLRVSAPEAFTVAGVGQLVGTTKNPSSGTTTHEYAAEAVRDVTVTVGQLETLERTVDNVRVHLAAASYPGRPELSVWGDEVGATIRRLQDYLGPFPYPDLWVSFIPDQTDGIEFPSAVQLGRLRLPAQRYVLTHELAHQYFYALVGNNQAQNPWLDESITSFVQKVIDHPAQDPPVGRDHDTAATVQWGRSMSQWQALSSASDKYADGVYAAGPDALIRARRATGAASFDAALRQYLRQNAHAIATPQDFAEAFAQLSDVMQILGRGLTVE